MKNLISLNWRSKLEGMENVNFLNDRLLYLQE